MDPPPLPILPSIDRTGQACFLELESMGELSDELLASFHHLYGKNWVKALEILDEGGIVCYVGEHSQRKVFQVGGPWAWALELMGVGSWTHTGGHPIPPRCRPRAAATATSSSPSTSAPANPFFLRWCARVRPYV